MSALPTSPAVGEVRDTILGYAVGDTYNCKDCSDYTRVELMAQYGPTLTAEIERLRAAQHEATRKAVLQEVRTRLVATDPVGLKTGPLFDWLTEEVSR